MRKLAYFLRTLALPGVVLAMIVAAMTAPAAAHAIIVSAVPAAGATVSGPEIDLAFTFNVRIDTARSKLTLTGPDGGVRDIPILPNDSPAVLASRLSALAPGSYSVRWQVLATDGHITRGDVKFTVAP
ncbi:copper resistance CopC family protein [Dongia sp.]|uniref:copper resistance CopC family protein n=1 Tax=Dongia sp. TaxID=1977262 RepID=UPI0035B34EC9